MIDVQTGSTEELVIKLLMKRYPITDKEVQDELGLPKKTVDRVLSALASQGIIVLEPLDDITYIRLIRRDFHFIGSNPTQKRSLRHKKDKPKKRKLMKKRDDYEGMMYG